MIEIKHRFTGEVVFRSETAVSVREAVLEAVKASANLRYANLGSADLGSADLGSANLGSADLGSADLRYADLRYANLGSANLGSANIRSANIRYANLGSANLGSANLAGTTCLSITGLPSGHAILAPLPEGWQLTIGCWQGTVTELRELIAQDDGWPEATGDEIVARRPMLAALADMCDAWSATRQHILDEVVAKWGNKVEASAE